MMHTHVMFIYPDTGHEQEQSTIISRCIYTYIHTHVYYVCIHNMYIRIYIYILCMNI